MDAEGNSVSIRERQGEGGMTKHNGVESLQAIDVPELRGTVGDTRLMRAAMDVFLAKHGLSNGDWNQHYVNGSKRKRKRK